MIGIYAKAQFKTKCLNLSQYEKSLLVLMCVSYILAHGNQGEHMFVAINQLMYDFFPMYNGMREPHKWVMFLVI